MSNPPKTQQRPNNVGPLRYRQAQADWILDLVQNKKGHEVGAKYDLERVREAARDERIELDEKRARDELGRFFTTWLHAYPFAADVLLELQPEDFCKTVPLGTPHAGEYDVYGLRISDALAARHGVSQLAWYLKLRLYEGFSGEVVFFVSLHPLEFDMERVGGLLRRSGSP